MSRGRDSTSSFGQTVRTGLLLSLALAAGACAGGGGDTGSVTPSPPILPPPPPPPPSPPPPPPPPPPPASSFETNEYFGSSTGAASPNSGLALIGASSAYARGASGRGIKVAVIDTNLDVTVSELFGQTSLDSIDICSLEAACATARSSSDIDASGHGTMVSSLIAAQKNGIGMHGVAYNSQIVHVRADRPGSCQEVGADKGCKFSDSTLARAIDYAIDRGVRVINLSLGGEIDNDPTLENAIRRAAAAGILVVISAGNEGKAATDTAAPEGRSPTEPAYIAGEAASLGRVVAVGAIDLSRKMADFSNRAGDTKSFYILAPGRRIIAAAPDDNIITPDLPACEPPNTRDCNDTDTDGDYYLVSGTSFAAPYVSGALALMLELFPNLTPENALAALLSSADDYIDTAPDIIRGEAAGVGIDAVSGVGILNLTRAFSPIGATSASFGAERVGLGQMLAPASGAFGDWAVHSGAFDGLIVQDRYARGFRIDTTRLMVGRSALSDLADRARYARSQAYAIRVGAASLSWFTPPADSTDPRRPWGEPEDPLFAIAVDLDGTKISGGRGGSPPVMMSGFNLLSDASEPVESAGGDWARFEQTLGALTFDGSASRSRRQESLDLGLTLTIDGGLIRIGQRSTSDMTSSMGGYLQSRFGGIDRSRLSATSLQAAYTIGSWTLKGSSEIAEVDLEGVSTSGVRTTAWMTTVERAAGEGYVRLAVGQPRRAETGALTFMAPVEIDATGHIRMASRTASLAPSGRQIDVEASWSSPLGPTTTLELVAGVSTSPHHVREAPAEGAVWLGIRGIW